MSKRKFPERLVAVFEDADRDDLKVAFNINELAGHTGKYSRNAAYYVLAGVGTIRPTAAEYLHWEPRDPGEILASAAVEVKK